MWIELRFKGRNQNEDVKFEDADALRISELIFS